MRDYRTSRDSIVEPELPIRVGSRDGTNCRCADEATCAAYDCIKSTSSASDGALSANGSGPPPRAVCHVRGSAGVALSLAQRRLRLARASASARGPVWLGR